MVFEGITYELWNTGFIIGLLAGLGSGYVLTGIFTWDGVKKYKWAMRKAGFVEQREENDNK